MSAKILAVGDVCGEPGLDYLTKNLRRLRKELELDFVVVNGENANVVGITPRQADAILHAGADVITLGNHTWTRTELRPYLDERRKILRPANCAPQCPGRGIDVYKTSFGDVCVMNLMGHFTLDTNTDNPFVIADGYMEEIREKIILVDFHAEGTSEKRAMGFLLDGKASAVWGTHTHVQTSDACVLPNGTGYITDLGMTGAVNSVIGIEPEQSIGKFFGDPPRRYDSAKGPAKLEGCGPWKEITKIVFPLIWPTVTTVIIFTLTGIFNAGGPILLFGADQYETTTISYWIFKQLYGDGIQGGTGNYNVVSCTGLCFTMVGVPIIMTIRWLLERRESAEY